MVKHKDNYVSNNNNIPSQKVRSIDELLAAKRASNQLGNNKASEAVEAATNVFRANAGKARRSELRNDLIKSAQLAQAQGEEDGIKQFLSEDIPAVMNALNSELRSNHVAVIQANEEKLLESSGVIDVEWSDYTSEYEMSFDTEEWGFNKATEAIEHGAQLSLEGSNEKDSDNPFSKIKKPS